jgi:hypothetical protein
MTMTSTPVVDHQNDVRRDDTAFVAVAERTPPPPSVPAWAVGSWAAGLTAAPDIVAESADRTVFSLSPDGSSFAEEGPAAAPAHQMPFVQSEMHAMNIEERTNRTRFELLARRFVRKELSPEDAARLEIATARIARIHPRVTAEDYEALADIAESTAEISQRRARYSSLLDELDD